MKVTGTPARTRPFASLTVADVEPSVPVAPATPVAIAVFVVPATVSVSPSVVRVRVVIV